MNPCNECLIDDKIFECCGRFPESGATASFPNTENRSLYACPNLSANGKCGIYEKRPYACQTHHCYLYDTMDSVGNGLQDLKAQWKGWQEKWKDVNLRSETIYYIRSSPQKIKSERIL